MLHRQAMVEKSRKRILFLCTKYPVKEDDSYMTSELSSALVRAGHHVDVVLIDWSEKIDAPTEMLTHRAIRVLKIAPRAWTGIGTLAYRMSKFMLSNRHAVTEINKFFQPIAYDACIGWSPALTVNSLAKLAKKSGVQTLILFIWDFFPIHHREIGMVPSGPIFWIAKRAEEHAIRKYSAIICNLPSNIKYLERNYNLGAQYVTSTPLWSDISAPNLKPREAIRDHYSLDKYRPIAIFGGQITDGRGISFMLDAARISEKLSHNILYLFVGDGRLVDLVKNRMESSNNVCHIPGVARKDYMSLVAACDVGMVATVPGVSSFSFPTKTIDYLRAGLPVVAAVEPSSDFLDIINAYKVGRGVEFNETERFAENIHEMANDQTMRSTIHEQAKRCLEEVFDVQHAAQKVLNIICNQRN